MNSENVREPEARGPIAYMARNGVAANLLMFFILAAGLVSMRSLVQEAFPVLSFNFIEVSVAYPGATPEEVEESIVVKIEERVESLEDVRETTSVAAEGHASVLVGLKSGARIDRALDRVEAAVARIHTFPAGAERPDIREMTNRHGVMRLALYGDVPERSLKELAHRTKDELSSLPEVSFVETTGVRGYEISIETPLRQLRALGLTVEDVSRAVRATSLDLSAGSIDTADEAVRIRTSGKKYSQQDFEEIVVLGDSDGTVVRLGDIAEVRDGFQDVDLIARYNGERAAFVDVYRSADEQVLAVAEAVQTRLDQVVAPSLPAGVSVDIWTNEAEIYESRLGVLLDNAFLGLILVLVALALFLQIRLAVWVAVGIGISFVGALAIMLALDVSINTVTLLGFIIAVGIVIDDAIVVAEQIHAERQRGPSGVVAAIRGARRVRKPVVFAVLTTMAAFSPLLFLPGPLGRVFGSISIILIAVLVLSLIESLFVLPNHLSHLPPPGQRPTNPVERFFTRIQSRVDRQLGRFVSGPLERSIRFATRQPAVVVAGGIGTIVLTVALVASGTVGLIFTEAVEADVVTAHLEMPEGTPVSRTAELARELEAAGHRAIDRLSAERPADAESLLAGVNFTVGARPAPLGGAIVQEHTLNPQPHIAAVEFKLLDVELRDVSSGTFQQVWREEAGALPEARSLTFVADLLDLGPPIQLELSHPDPDRLVQAADRASDRLREFEGVFEVRSDHAAGLRQVRIEARPEARTLGLTVDEMARQVRAAFFGDEALRLQRGREEVPVYARLAAEERDAIADVENYLIRTPAGGETPLSRVADARLEDSRSSIRRKNGRRVVTITADLDPAVVTAGEIADVLTGTILPELADANPGLAYAFGGQQQQQVESLDALAISFVLALIGIYALLAIPLGSYTRPILIMAIIPFGIVGAVLGHLVMGLDLSLTSSIWGVIGLAGIVVNDSLMMVDFIDARLRRGAPVKEAIVEGAKERFRPIFLTSLTTFLGFAPLIFERSVQAQFLIPLGVSIGFGILFATIVLMLIVPALAVVYFRFAAPSRSAEAADEVVLGEPRAVAP